MRAVAIGAVMLFHSVEYVPRFQLFGGPFGVDLFFVLSGFLITTLLVREWNRSGRIDLKQFFKRRGLRLLPALVLALLLGGAVAAYIGSNAGRDPYPKAALLAGTYVANLFQTSPEYQLGLLTHTWSLAIEAQYYLVWPFVVAAALNRNVDKRRLAFGLAVLGLVVSPLSLFVPKTDGIVQSLLWTGAKGSGLLMGSALALGLAGSHRLRGLLGRTPLAVVGAVIATAIVVTLSPTRPVRWWTLAVLVVCFAIVIGHLSIGNGSLFARVARTQPLPAIGLISYGLYLYHLPLNHLVHGFPRSRVGWLSVAVATALTFTVAIASYLIVERPALRRKRRGPVRAAERR